MPRAEDHHRAMLLRSGDAVSGTEDVEHVHEAGDVGIVCLELGVLMIPVPLLLQGVDQSVEAAMVQTKTLLDRVGKDPGKGRRDRCDRQKSSGHPPDQDRGDRCREETIL